MLALEDHGLYEGARANLTVFDAPSRLWSLVERAERAYVLKNGRVIGENGELRQDVVSA